MKTQSNGTLWVFVLMLGMLHLAACTTPSPEQRIRLQQAAAQAGPTLEELEKQLAEANSRLAAVQLEAQTAKAVAAAKMQEAQTMPAGVEREKLEANAAAAEQAASKAAATAQQLQQAMQTTEKYTAAAKTAAASVGQLLQEDGSVDQAALAGIGGAVATVAPVAWVPYVGLATTAITGLVAVFQTLGKRRAHSDGVALARSLEKAKACSEKLREAMADRDVVKTLNGYQTAGAGAMVDIAQGKPVA